MRTFCAAAVGRRLTIERELKAADEAPAGRLIARFTGAADVLAEASHEVEVAEQALAKLEADLAQARQVAGRRAHALSAAALELLIDYGVDRGLGRFELLLGLADFAGALDAIVD